MRLNFLIIIISWFMFSCINFFDNTYEFLENIDYEIYFNGNEGETSAIDSVKKSLKIKSVNKPIEITPIVRTGTLNVIKYTIEPEDGAKITRDGITLDGIISDFIVGEAISLEFEAEQVGIYSIEFSALTDVDLKRVSTYKKIIFDNLPPVASFNIVKKTSSMTESLEYNFNADDSYDRDSKFGGGIQSYKYVISKIGDGSNESEAFGEVGTVGTSYIFPIRGVTYSIMLIVTDNEGIKSEPTSREIKIQ